MPAIRRVLRVRVVLLLLQVRPVQASQAHHSESASCTSARRNAGDHHNLQRAHRRHQQPIGLDRVLGGRHRRHAAQQRTQQTAAHHVQLVRLQLARLVDVLAGRPRPLAPTSAQQVQQQSTRASSARQCAALLLHQPHSQSTTPALVVVLGHAQPPPVQADSNTCQQTPAPNVAHGPHHFQHSPAFNDSDSTIVVLSGCGGGDQ